jgi:hypothetical protein
MNSTTLHDMIAMKLFRNKNIIRTLELGNKVIKLEMIARYRVVQQNTERIAKAQAINAIEEKQLHKYDLIRESEVLILTEEYNNIELDISDMYKELLILKEQILECQTNINNMNSKIPSHGSGTNYTPKIPTELIFFKDEIFSEEL